MTGVTTMPGQPGLCGWQVEWQRAVSQPMRQREHASDQFRQRRDDRTLRAGKIVENVVGTINRPFEFIM